MTGLLQCQPCSWQDVLVNFKIRLVQLPVNINMAMTANLPTLYEYYASGGINAGLSVDKPYFTLNERNITLYSGAMHYFRVPREYWRDRLRKMRAAGLNAVETYVPWNLHEPQSDVYDFGDGQSDMSDFLHLREFFKIVQEEDLLSIVRPGPYICSEWEFGGFPSWLLRQKNIRLRTSESTYMQYVKRYFNMLLPILALFQFTKGGSIIAFQVENEYGSTEGPRFVPDREYLKQVRQIMLDNGIEELLFTSDAPSAHGDRGSLPGVLFQTANFDDDPSIEFNALRMLQPGKPFMAMEFWDGWFDHWSETHHVRSVNNTIKVLQEILDYQASVNFYMFEGGTSWGFLNGANLMGSATDNRGFQPDTTSYDYDSPLTEAGDYTTKYVMIKEAIRKNNKILTKLPGTPSETERKAYPDIPIAEHLVYQEILENIKEEFNYMNVVPMEILPINNNSGQSYGYIIYRKEHLSLPPYSFITIEGRVCDTVMVLVNGMLLSKPLTKISDLNEFGFWRKENSSLVLTTQKLTDATVDLVVENWGRVNFGGINQFNQFKGIWQGDVSINNIPIRNWTVKPLEFKKSWNKGLRGWHSPLNPWLPGPALHRTTFVTTHLHDTFIDMRQWTKGIVIVNGFVLGRYTRIGPQQTLYLPAPFLQMGVNEIVIFEHYFAADRINFSENPIYRTGP